MKDKQTAEEAIELISGRIMDEYRKHQSLDWAKIAAIKIHSQWFEYYTQQNYEMQKEIDELKEDLQHKEALIAEFEEVQHKERKQYNDLKQSADEMAKQINKAAFRDVSGELTKALETYKKLI